MERAERVDLAERASQVPFHTAERLDSMPCLTAAQLAQYETDGFVVLVSSNAPPLRVCCPGMLL